MPTYSVVIPVYNAERYLESCIHSVMEQNSSSACEIILVDDGSSDRSPQICDGFAQQFPFVKVIHQVNQGVSAARNAGIAAASGSYLLFLDGDDCWDNSLLQKLDEQIPQRPDVIEFGYLYFDGHTDYQPTLPAVQTEGMTGMEYFDTHKAINTMPMASSCTAAFKRQLLEENNVRFPTGVSYGEDFTFHMHCLKYAKSVVSILQPLYLYRMNEQSATHTPTVKKMRDMLSACANMYRLFPCALFANYYCMKILNVEKLGKREAGELNALLRENRDILQHVSGTKPRLTCMLYRLFGWYGAARLMQLWFRVRYPEKG